MSSASTSSTSSSITSSTSTALPLINVRLYSLPEAQPTGDKSSPDFKLHEDSETAKLQIKATLLDSKIKIYLGSASYLKLKAVNEVFVGAECQGCDVKSGVSDQPVGQLETLTGARNRARQAQKLHSEGFLWIGIENGMLHATETGAHVRSQWVDVAAIVIISAQGQEWVIWSEAIEIPAGNIPKCLDEQTGRAFDVWSPLKDPHSKYVNRPRSDFLSKAMYHWFVANLSLFAP